ncbi:MAG: DUF3598 domain-containing protein [Rhodanobacteraceae bacterium]|nr:DUF3598 domain-containing protein [Rhodanobacteraceae bacterium]
MQTLQQAMPTLARHAGTWEGQCRYYDAAGELVDEHQSRLICSFPEDGPYPYLQTNVHRWADGRSETRVYPATCSNGRVHWDSAEISGWAAEVAADPDGLTLMLRWIPRAEPAVCVHEWVQLSACGRFRSRIGQWVEDGRVRLRMISDEERVEGAAG